MDQRSKNRFKEHGKHDLINTHKTSPHQPGYTLWWCSCDWFGWLKK